MLSVYTSVPLIEGIGLIFSALRLLEGSFEIVEYIVILTSPIPEVSIGPFYIYPSTIAILLAGGI